MKDNEHNIIKRCIEGDIKSQFLLYKKYSKGMYNIAIRLLNNKMDAEDVLQESFVKAFENIGRLENVNAFGSWLRRIVINNSVSFLRTRRFYLEDLAENNIILSDEESSSILTVDPAIVHGAIKELPDGARSILVLYSLEGYNHREIAEMLNISESTSRTQYRRALGLLNKSLKEKIYVN